VTAHDVVVLSVTRITSVGVAGSPTWNWVTPVCAVGNPKFDATTHVSLPETGLAPAATVVDGLFMKTSVAATAHHRSRQERCSQVE
jgi:hypothetical protein